VKAHTGSGNISLSGGASRFEGSTGSGDVTAEGLTGVAEVATGSGGIDCRWTLLPAGSRVEAETGSGGVRLTLPAASTLAGELHSSSGGIRSDFPGTESDHGRRWTFAGGDGASKLTVGTGSGGITVTKGS
jgi:DUF4097 and DUF4098 domain-containing protein YvlB